MRHNSGLHVTICHYMSLSGSLGTPYVTIVGVDYVDVRNHWDEVLIRSCSAIMSYC